MWTDEGQGHPHRIRSADATEQEKDKKKSIHCLVTQSVVAEQHGHLLEALSQAPQSELTF